MKIIQISTVQNKEGAVCIYALGEDGCMYELLDSVWVSMPVIPNSKK